MRRRLLYLVGGAILLVGLRAARAGEAPDPASIVKKSLDSLYYGGTDMVAQVTMSLFDSSGKARIRTMSMLRKNVNARGEQNYFIYFHSPPDVGGMAFLIHKFPDKDDDRWMFIPAVRMVKRVAASDKRSSFVGSDFTYDDVSGRDALDEKSTLVRSEVLNGRPCYVLESVPRERSSFAKRVSWIDKERFLPLKEQFISDKGEHIRTFSADEVKESGGVWTISKRTMSDSRSGRRTEVLFRDVRYNVGLSDEVFTEGSLRSPPRQWLK